MPRGDRTGPSGMGPKTGRAAGFCAGFGVPGYANPNVGFGCGAGLGKRGGFGFGRGRGWRHQFYATGQPRWMRGGFYAPQDSTSTPANYPDPQGEKQILKDQVVVLKSELDAISARISKLEGTK